VTSKANYEQRIQEITHQYDVQVNFSISSSFHPLPDIAQGAHMFDKTSSSK